MNRVCGRQSGRGVITHLFVLGAGLLLLSGCGRDALLDERNVYYVRGMKLRDQKRHEDAAEAFHTCLRLSPRSAKAHLQLALLYEDALDDPLQCVYHYRLFLDMRPDDANADVVRDWLADAERELGNVLARQHQRGEAPPSPVSSSASRNLDPARKATLMRRISELSSKNLTLQNTVTELKQRLEERRTFPALEAHNPSGSAVSADQVQQRETAAGPAREVSPGREAAPAHDSRTIRPALRTSEGARSAGVSEPPAQPVRRHRVVRGDTLSSLSRRYYGSLKYWPLLRDYNQDVLRGRDTLKLGEVLEVPALETLMDSDQG